MADTCLERKYCDVFQYNIDMNVWQTYTPRKSSCSCRLIGPLEAVTNRH